jgi:hypothetical protein
MDALANPTSAVEPQERRPPLDGLGSTIRCPPFLRL